MFEGRDNAGGLGIVGVALFALVLFTGLLYVAGSSSPPLPIIGAEGGPTRPPTPRPTPSQSPSTSASGAASPGTSVATSGSAAGSPDATGSAASSTKPSATAKPAATAKPSATAKVTPRPSRTPRPSGSTAPGFELPANPQPASANLDNGEGGCEGFPTGGVVITTTFRIPAAGKLTATSPLGQVLTGTIAANGTFKLSGESPVESWSGKLTAAGGTGSYSVVSNDCTETYTTAITFT